MVPWIILGEGSTLNFYLTPSQLLVNIIKYWCWFWFWSFTFTLFLAITSTILFLITQISGIPPFSNLLRHFGISLNKIKNSFVKNRAGYVTKTIVTKCWKWQLYSFLVRLESGSHHSHSRLHHHHSRLHLHSHTHKRLSNVNHVRIHHLAHHN